MAFPIGAGGDVIVKWDDAPFLLLSDVAAGGIKLVSGAAGGVSLRFNAPALARASKAAGGLISVDFLDAEAGAPSGIAALLSALHEKVVAGAPIL